MLLSRTELPAGEDLSLLSPKSILKRGKFLTMGLMMAILDPPREEAITAIAQAHKAGIVVKMITGENHVFIARSTFGVVVATCLRCILGLCSAACQDAALDRTLPCLFTASWVSALQCCMPGRCFSCSHSPLL